MADNTLPRTAGTIAWRTAAVTAAVAMLTLPLMGLRFETGHQERLADLQERAEQLATLTDVTAEEADLLQERAVEAEAHNDELRARLASTEGFLE